MSRFYLDYRNRCDLISLIGLKAGRTCFFLVCFSLCFGYNSLNITANWSLNFYKKLISPLQGQNICNFSPTCSQFYKQSINKYGVVVGSMMGADRLIRCNPWAWTYLDKYYYGIDNDRISDPLENHYIKISNIKYQISNTNSKMPTTNNQQLTTELDFADYLYNSGDYMRAIGEYKRLLFFYTDSDNNIKSYIQLMLGESYFHLKDYQQALTYFGLQDNPFINYNRARVFFEQEDYSKTREELDSVIDWEFDVMQSTIERSEDEQQIVLFGLSFYKEHNFSEGARFFERHAPRGASVTNKLCNYNGKDIKKRNRIASTLFSAVIPGLGQIYSNRFGDGLYSFLTVVGSGLIANYYYYHDESKIKFSIFSILTAFFWAGNVYGANIAARDYNTYQINHYLSKINNELIEFNFTPDYKEFRK